MYTHANSHSYPPTHHTQFIICSDSLMPRSTHLQITHTHNYTYTHSNHIHMHTNSSTPSTNSHMDHPSTHKCITQTYTHIYLQMCIPTLLHPLQTHIYIQTHMYICIYIYLHASTHTMYSCQPYPANNPHIHSLWIDWFIEGDMDSLRMLINEGERKRVSEYNSLPPLRFGLLWEAKH